jgi:hypothetical protein
LWVKKVAVPALALLILASLLPSRLRQALAWNPSVSDLSGTDSSSDDYVNTAALNRFDIPGRTGTNGLQAGEDTDSIAFLVKLDMGTARFQVSGMSARDQYEVYFTIGTVSFCILFHATGASAGTCTLFKLVDSSWSSQVSLTPTTITSGTLYSTTDWKIGFILTDATDTAYGSVKFVISKSYLVSLGASGSVVTGIYATAYSSGDGSPGTGVLRDRCPSTGSVSWTLGGNIPDLPMGILLLALPLIAVYAYLRRSKRRLTYGFKVNSWQLRKG